MKSFAMAPRANIPRTVCLLTLLFSALSQAQSDWQLITQPPINYLSAIGIGSNSSGNGFDVNHVFLSAEHDGEWSNSSSNPTLGWTFTHPGVGYFQVHGTRYLAAPGRPQNVHLLDLHGTVYYYSSQNLAWYLVPVNPDGTQDGWYSLAIDPTDVSPIGQRVLVGGPGRIKYFDGAVTPTMVTEAHITFTGLTNPPLDSFSITDIQYAPDLTNVVWASTSEASGWDDVPPAGTPRTCQGVLRSEDYGHDWNAFTPISIADANCVYAVAPISSTQVYAVTKAGLWKGTYNPIPQTMSWSEITFPSPIFGGQRVSSIFYPSPVGNLTTLYVGFARPPPSTNGVYKGTTTNGQNWTWVTMPFSPIPKVNALGGLLNNMDTFYAAFSNGDVQKRNLDGSITTLQGQHAGYPIATVAIPPGQPNDNTVYVGTTCQGGIYQGIYNSSFAWVWTTQMKPPLPNQPNSHSHFHYVMRLAQDPSTAANLYVTEDAYVFSSMDGGANWTRTFPIPEGTPECLQQPCGVHVHGLAVAPISVNPPNNTLYVGSGHGNWPGDPFSDSPTGRIWRSTDSGSHWVEVTGTGTPFPFPGPSSTCDSQTKGGCYSVYTIAVSPNDPNSVFVGTFGHENYAGDLNKGTGIGVVRGTFISQTQPMAWQSINNGLCSDPGVCRQGSPPPPTALSLFVGTVTMDNASPTANVYIATLNGIYRMPENGTTWQDISPSLSNPPVTCDANNECRRFESIAVSANGSVLFAGTSQPVVPPPPELPGPPGAVLPPRIFKSTNGGMTWTLTNIPTMPARAWAEQYRVRDIKMGAIKAYAAIEGSGIYRMDIATATQRPRR